MGPDNGGNNGDGLRSVLDEKILEALQDIGGIKQSVQNIEVTQRGILSEQRDLKKDVLELLQFKTSVMSSAKAVAAVSSILVTCVVYTVKFAWEWVRSLNKV